MAHDVFISYSHTDAAVTNAICHRLEEHGIRCWYAPRDIRAGDNFDTALVNAIKSTRVFILVFSEKSGRSHYVHQEVRTAFEAGKLVIPFRIAETMPEGGMELLLKGVHWLDAINPPVEAHLDRLLETVCMALGLKDPLNPEQPTSNPDKHGLAGGLRVADSAGGEGKAADRRPARKGMKKRSWAVLAGVLTLLAVLALVYSTGGFDSVLSGAGLKGAAVTPGPEDDQVQGGTDAVMAGNSRTDTDSGSVLSFRPLGEATVSTTDGFQVSCPANCILFRGYYDMIAGLADTPDYGAYSTNISYFSGMKSLAVIPETTKDEYGTSRTEYSVQASMKDGRTVSYTYSGGEFLYTNGGGKVVIDISKVKDVRFDFEKENSTVLKLAKVTPVSGSPYYAPLDLLFVNIWSVDMGVGSAWFDGVPFGGSAVPFGQISTLEILESIDNRFNGWGVKAKYKLVMPEGDAMSGDIDEDSYDFVGVNRFGPFRASVLDGLKRIDVPQE